MITKQFLLVSLSTGFSSILYLLISHNLDNFISPIYSNALGLLIDIILDFIFQSLIFLNNINLYNTNLIIKFIGFKIITTLSSQILFTMYVKYFNKKNFNITLLRIIISSLVFIVLVFPLNKYFVFKK